MTEKYTESEVRRLATKNGIGHIDAFMLLHQLLGDDAPQWLKQYVSIRERRRERMR